jgi:hypothetical protein
MKAKKIVYLFLALVFPIAIFLFLKQFGRNEFNVESLLKEPTPSLPSCEGYTYQFPYTITDSVLTQLEWSVNDSITLVVFDNSSLDDSHERSTQLARVLKEIPGNDYQIIYTTYFEILKTKLNDTRLVSLMDTSNVSVIRSCVLWLSHYEDIVLIDSKRRILGKYSLLNREDSDRLILEMKILLRQY